MAHKHHLVPKYKGGSDNPNNLVEVSVTQHAMFHYCNWKLWGNKEDWLAWKGLVGEINKEDIVSQLRLKGAKKGLKVMWERTKYLRENSPEYLNQVKENIQRIQPLGTQASLSEKSKQKRKNSFKRINHQQGENNSQYGTMWITNGQINKKIRKNEDIPESYYPGRKLK